MLDIWIHRSTNGWKSINLSFSHISKCRRASCISASPKHQNQISKPIVISTNLQWHRLLFWIFQLFDVMNYEKLHEGVTLEYRQACRPFRKNDKKKVHHYNHPSQSFTRTFLLPLVMVIKQFKMGMAAILSLHIWSRLHKYVFSENSEILICKTWYFALDENTPVV